MTSPMAHPDADALAFEKKANAILGTASQIPCKPAFEAVKLTMGGRRLRN